MKGWRLATTHQEGLLFQHLSQEEWQALRFCSVSTFFQIKPENISAKELGFDLKFWKILLDCDYSVLDEYFTQTWNWYMLIVNHNQIYLYSSQTQARIQVAVPILGGSPNKAG